MTAAVAVDILEQLRALPLFAALSDEAFQKLAPHCTLLVLGEKTLVFREGEYGFDFYVILEGEVDVIKTAAGIGDRVLATIGSNNFFGEMGPMVGQPRSASIVARSAVRLLQIGHAGFEELLEGCESFKQAMDRAYLDRALAGYLKVIPLFKDIAPEPLKEFVADAQLVTYAKGQSVIKEGESGDRFYIIRRGFVKVTKIIGGREVLLAYLRENGWFGEMALVDGAPRSATVTALGTVETVEIGKASFEALMRAHPEVHRVIAETVRTRRAEQARTPDAEREAKMALLVEKGLIQVGEVLTIDLNTCTRCGNCEENCANTHGGTSRLTRKGFNIGTNLLPASCYMCPDPECMKGCRFGVIMREKDGSVAFRDHCTGCAGCARSCPYGVITMAKKEEGGGPPQRPIIERLLPWKRPPAAVEKPKVKREAVKCDMCKGLGFTACLSNCPTGAIRRVDPRSLLT